MWGLETEVNQFSPQEIMAREQKNKEADQEHKQQQAGTAAAKITAAAAVQERRSGAEATTGGNSSSSNRKQIRRGGGGLRKANIQDPLYTYTIHQQQYRERNTSAFMLGKG